MTGGYTRLGAPIRHLTSRLLAQASERRLLLLIGDGLMCDEGYEGRYAWADVAHAVEEAEAAGVAIYYVGVGGPAWTRCPRCSVPGVRNASAVWRSSPACSPTSIESWWPHEHDNGDTRAHEDRYLATGTEVALIEHAYRRRLPVMLTGPTGCGKTRLVEHVGPGSAGRW